MSGSSHYPFKVCDPPCPPKVIDPVIQTGGNNPHISNKMRIASLLKLSKRGKVEFANKESNAFGKWAGGPSGSGRSIEN
jgi:hypothetical protein